MSASLPTDRFERDALAGEYVLGTLNAADARTVTNALKSDPAFQRQVIAWEDRLAPLSRLALPESAPSDLWDRIEARLPAPVTRPAIRTARQSWLASQKGWRLWAIGASLAAAAFAGVIAVQATRPPVLEASALQQADPSQPPSALATAPTPAPTSTIATQPVPDNGVRKANSDAKPAVRPAAGDTPGTVRPPTPASGDGAAILR